MRGEVCESLATVRTLDCTVGGGKVKVGSRVQVADVPEPEDEGIALAQGDGPVGDCS